MSKFNPLELMPEDLAATWKRSAENRAKVADRQPKAAIMLKCLDCCAWQPAEIRKCELSGCALWALRARYLGQDTNQD